MSQGAKLYNLQGRGFLFWQKKKNRFFFLLKQLDVWNMFQNILENVFCLFANLAHHFTDGKQSPLEKGEMLWLSINMESDFIMQNFLIVKIKSWKEAPVLLWQSLRGVCFRICRKIVTEQNNFLFFFKQVNQLKLN